METAKWIHESIEGFSDTIKPMGSKNRYVTFFMLRVVGLWGLFLVLAILNATLREKLVSPILGQSAALLFGRRNLMPVHISSDPDIHPKIRNKISQFMLGPGGSRGFSGAGF